MALETLSQTGVVTSLPLPVHWALCRVLASREQRERPAALDFSLKGVCWLLA